MIDPPNPTPLANGDLQAIPAVASPPDHLGTAANAPYATPRPGTPDGGGMVQRFIDVWDSSFSWGRTFEAATPADPAWRMTDRQFDLAKEGIPAEYWPELGWANSDKGLQVIHDQLVLRVERERRLSTMGVLPGLGYGLLASVSDPTTVGIALATGGVGEAFGLGEAFTSMGRVGAMVRHGIVAVPTNIAAESLAKAERGGPSNSDILHAGLSGLGLSIITGGLAGRAAPESAKLLTQTNAAIRSVELADVRDAGGTLTPKGEAYFKGVDRGIDLVSLAREIDHAEEERVAAAVHGAFDAAEARLAALEPGTKLSRGDVNAILEGTGHSAGNQGWPTAEAMQAALQRLRQQTLLGALDRGGAEPLAAPSADRAGMAQPPEPDGTVTGAMGAASPDNASLESPGRPPLPPKWRPGDIDYGNVSDARSTAGAVRPSMMGRLLQSPSPAVRRLARMLAEDPLPGRGGEKTVDAGTEVVKREHEARMFRYAEEIQKPMQRWWARNDPGFLRGREAAKADFREQVFRAGMGEPTTDPDVRAVADIGTRYFGEALDRGQAHAVPGLDTIQKSPTYRPVHWLQSKIEAAVAKWGAKNVERALTEAVIPATAKFTPDLANRIAVGLLRTVSESARHTNLNLEMALSGKNAELLRTILTNGGADEATIADVLNQLSPPPSTTGALPMTKFRTLIDHLHETQATDAAGNAGTLRITDLMDTDEFSALNRYSRQIEGASVKAAISRAMGLSESDLPSFQAILGRLSRGLYDTLATQGVTGKAANKIVDAEISKLQLLGRSIDGTSLWEPTAMGDFLNTTRKLTNAVLMGRAQFSHLSNLGATIGEAGFVNMLRQCPAIARVFVGDRTAPLTRELMSFTGIGSEQLRNELLGRISPLVEDGENGLTHGMVDRALDRVNKFQADITFFGPLMSFMQRTSLLANAQMWATISKSGKVPGLRRLATMGLDAEAAAKITAEIRANARYGPGGSLEALNLQNWDPQVRADYVTSLNKWSRRVAQTADIGQLSQWMTKEWGKSLIQFRLFHIAAYEKQTLHGAYTRDLTTFRNWAMTSIVGAMSYVAREYLSSFGQPNQGDYLDRALAPGKIASASFGRAGWTSVFPGFVSAGSRYTGGALYQDPFSGLRSTGLENDPLLGSPTVAALWNARSLPTALVDALAPGRRLSREDFHLVRGVLPLQNSLGLKNVLDRFEKTLPPHSEPSGY